MKRFWLLVLAVLMLGQGSYAAAGAYCLHEGERSSAAAHWGHHVHAHAVQDETNATIMATEEGTRQAREVLGLSVFHTAGDLRRAFLIDDLALFARVTFWFGFVNVLLAVFNLLPIPPLDGSHVAKYLMPRPLAIRYVQFARYGMLVLMLLLFMGDKVLQVWFTPAFVAT